VNLLQVSAEGLLGLVGALVDDNHEFEHFCAG
jgi:hypothetical protein